MSSRKVLGQGRMYVESTMASFETPHAAGLGRAKVALQLSSPSGSSQKCICRASKGTSSQVKKCEEIMAIKTNNNCFYCEFILSLTS